MRKPKRITVEVRKLRPAARNLYPRLRCHVLIPSVEGTSETDDVEQSCIVAYDPGLSPTDNATSAASYAVKSYFRRYASRGLSYWFRCHRLTGERWAFVACLNDHFDEVTDFLFLDEV